MPILFYKLKDPYGCFSNFSRHPVTYEGKVWPTSEHAFQGMKFSPNEELMERVRNAPTPRVAADIGRDRSLPLRDDWEKPPSKGFPPLSLADGIDRQGFVAEPLFTRVKDLYMYEVCLAKFQQHEDIREILLNTGVEPIIEDSSLDAYWGWGPAKIGQNKLGRILMFIRDRLR